MDTEVFLFFPVSGTRGLPTVSVRVDSGEKTASIFRVYFRSAPF